MARAPDLLPTLIASIAPESSAGGSSARLFGEGPSAVGGLVVVSGAGEERLGYLAALLSEALPCALWAMPPELHGSEREMRHVRMHLSSGTSVVQVVETERQVSDFAELARRSDARFLLVRVHPPSASEHSSGPPSSRHSPLVRVPTRASLVAQLEIVLAAWKRALGAS